MTEKPFDPTLARKRRAAVFGAASAVALGLALQLAGAGAAAAQDAAPLPTAADDGSGNVQGVVVTASRVQRSGFTAPTPVTTVGVEQINQRAPTTLGEVLANIPSFRPTSTPNTAGVTSLSGGQVTADLRGLGATRTLVLVDGRRHVPTNSSGTVDLRLIPTLLVQNVEVVTGGASAAWGSDAVAGVVNFILKDRIDGIQATAQYGQSKYDDNFEYKASLAGGGSAAGGKIRFVAGADYLLNLGIRSQYTRPWGRREVGVITNPNYASNGLPNIIITPNFHTANMTQGGLIVSGPLRGTAFAPGGVPYQFQFGQVFGANMIGGSREGENPLLSANLGAPMEALSSLAHVDFDVSSNLQLFAEFSAAWTKTGGNSQQPRDQGNLVIQRDNAFLPASIRAQMTSLGLNTITIGRINDDTGYTKLESQNRTYRGVVGAKGELGGGWKWDAYYQYGRNSYALRFGPNNRINRNWLLAVDAVTNPANGQVVCRSTLTNPGNGCIPINVFGNGSAQANDFAFGTSTYDLRTTQQVAALNIQGEPFHLPAGPVSLAVGAEYRSEKGEGLVDPISQEVQPNGSIGGFAFGNQLPFKGKYHVKEVYAETVVPILHDVPGSVAFDLNGAVRRTDYSISGAVTTWKVGFTYQPFEQIRFRGTLSRDIRAPNLSEFFIGGTASSFTNVFDPALNSTVQIREVGSGSLALTPEVAHTSSVGFAYEPSWLRRFSVSVDYYAIRVDDVISSLGAPQLARGCFSGVTEYCSNIVFNPNGTIAFIRSPQLNLNQLQTQGYDIEAQYTLPMSVIKDGWGGALSLRVLATYVDKLTSIEPAGAVNRVGQLSQFGRVSGVPHWTANANLGYRADRWGVNLETRYIGKGHYSNDLHEGCCMANTVNDNSVPALVYFNLGAQYRFNVLGRNLEVYGLVNNLLDRAPPRLPSGAAGGTNESSTNSAFYDVIGRMYKVGLRFQY